MAFATAAPAHGADAIDRLAHEALARWEIPGIALATVRDGNIVRIETYGLRDAEAGLPVTRGTLFALGSITKAFTVAWLWQLAESGRLDWRAPVSRYIKGFSLPGPGGGRPVSVGDLVSHLSGLPRHDALWYLDAFSRDQLIRRMQHLDRFARPGKAFQYNNLTLMLAGAVGERITGKRWREAVERRLLRPLGMAAARIGRTAFLAAPDHAQGYFPGDDGRVRVPVRDDEPVAPAAGLYADIEDAARWLAALERAGSGQAIAGADGSPVLSPASVRAMWTPQTGDIGPSAVPEIGRLAYGMGFFVTTYRGRRFVYHPGVIDGYAGLIAILPDIGFGAVVLTNVSGSNPAPAALAYTAFDQALGLKRIDWLRRFPSAAAHRAYRHRLRARQDAEAAAERRRLPSEPGRAPAAFVGTYENPAYGAITIGEGAAGHLAGRLYGIAFDLEPWGPDRWRVTDTVWPIREGLELRFEVAPDGRARVLWAAIADGPTYRHNAGPLLFKRIN